jgi:hypothetical protein
MKLYKVLANLVFEADVKNKPILAARFQEWAKGKGLSEIESLCVWYSVEPEKWRDCTSSEAEFYKHAMKGYAKLVTMAGIVDLDKI